MICAVWDVSLIFYNIYGICIRIYQGSADRKEHLREGKYFECECSLCKDPCELQSHLSSVLCPRCKKGFVGLQDTSMIDPYERSQWQCQMCKSTYGGRLIRATLNICRILIDECEDDVKAGHNLKEQTCNLPSLALS